MYCLKVLFAVWIPEECRRHEVEAGVSVQLFQPISAQLNQPF